MQIISPTGVIIDLEAINPATRNGLTISVPIASKTLPGVVFSTTGTGDFALSSFTGRRGAFDIWLVMGASGTACTVFYIAEAATSAAFVRLAVSASNQLTFTVADKSGTTVAAATSSGITGGTKAHVQGVWDSAGSADFRVNGVAVALSTSPSAAWTPGFDMTRAYVGYAPSATSFTGTVLKVQAGITPVVAV